MLRIDFFDRDAGVVAQELVGKVIRRRLEDGWLAASIVETEAYFLQEKGSHASLGKTPSREALFMAAGTIYMYYARGGDSLNVSCLGPGNAVLIKSAVPFSDGHASPRSIERMHALNPAPSGRRADHRLCSGQTLLCRALNLKVPDWDRKQFNRDIFFIEDVGYRPPALINARRLGIPKGRDEHLLLRYIDEGRLRSATKNPLTVRSGPRDHRRLLPSQEGWSAVS